jgi:hypothetical protein
MYASFIDLQSLAMFIILSLLFMIAAFRFDFKAMQNHPERISAIFLVAGVIVGFSDLIIMLQDQDSSLLAQDNAQFSKQLGVILLSPFYGIVFAAVTWFGAGARKEE